MSVIYPVPQPPRVGGQLPGTWNTPLTTGAPSHDASGALAADVAVIAGTATHLTLHTSTGALASEAATIAGTAAHQHVATGALASDAAVIAGTAAHLTLHTSTGALDSQAGTIAGAAAHEHASSGALASEVATIEGTADHAADGTHATDGALASADGTIAGTATHLTLHTSTGALASEPATVAGEANHAVVHEASGALQSAAATIEGTAAGPGQVSAGAGRSRRRERYIARYKGEEYEFSTYEALEDFVNETKEAEKKKPRKLRKPIKIRLEPTFAEEVSEVIYVPKDIYQLPASKALEQVRKLELKLKQTDEEDEEEWLILTS